MNKCYATLCYFYIYIIQVRRFAYQLATRYSCKFPASWDKKEMAGKDWFRGFMRRNQALSIRRPEATSLSRATSFNRLQFLHLAHTLNPEQFTIIGYTIIIGLHQILKYSRLI